MEVHTLNRGFLRQDVIDGFASLIWTERYYGDSEVEMTVPATTEMIQKLPVGIFLGLKDSNEIMILETVDIDDGKMKFNGISLLAWLDNRFVRTSTNHEDKYWYIEDQKAGNILWSIIYYMCHEDSPYLTGATPTGIASPGLLAIPGLLDVADYDTSGPNIKVGVPFGPVYKAMKEIAETYEIGMQLLLEDADDTSYSLKFRSYKGLDRSSYQVIRPVVRFSPQMDSFTDIKELQSIAAFKTKVYMFAPSDLDGLATVPGVSVLPGPGYTGFDLRALMEYADDISTDQVGGDAAKLVSILNSRADIALTENKFVKTVDGEIVPDSQFKYGVHYNLGDIIEVQGHSGIVQTARITEYIRSQDSTGEKAYPTVFMID